MVSRGVFLLFFSFEFVSGVSNRNLYFCRVSQEKNVMIHLGVLLLLPPLPRGLFSLPLSLSLSSYFFSFVVFVTHSLYITFQPDSLTLSVSRNKETYKKKNNQPVTVVIQNKRRSMKFLTKKKKKTSQNDLMLNRSCVNVSRSMLAKPVFKLVMLAGNYTV